MKFKIFFKNYLISCLVQLLRITFHKMLHFRIKLIFFLSLLFLIHRSLTNTSFHCFEPKP